MIDRALVENDDPNCVCPGCRLLRLAGNVAHRVANLPHQDRSELVILRFFPAGVYLDRARPSSAAGPEVCDVAAKLPAPPARWISTAKLTAELLVEPFVGLQRLAVMNALGLAPWRRGGDA